MSAWNRICGAAVIRRPFARRSTKETMHRSLPAASLIALVAGTVSRAELEAARHALERGATHLVVPTIADWKEMRTDDPIGAFVGDHSTVTVELRLMALRPPAV